jgi:integrase
MSKKSNYYNELGSKMQTSHSRFDKFSMLALHDLPLFAAACHNEKDPADVLDATQSPQAIPVVPVDCAHLSDPAQGRADFAPQVLVAVAGPLTPDKLIQLVGGWSDLKESRRQALVTAIRHTEHILSVCRDKLHGVEPWSCAGLNRCLWAHAPAVYGFTKATHRNAVSGLRYVLCRIGWHADAGHKRNKLSPPWQDLYDRLPTEERRRGMVLFFRALTVEGITPQNVAVDSIDRFETWCRDGILQKDPGGMGRRTAGNWDYARQNIPGWPQVEIVRSGMRDHYGITWDAFPASFTADAERMLANLASGPFDNGNPFARLAARAKEAAYQPNGADAKNKLHSPRSVRRALSLRTIGTRRDQIKLAATGLVLSGLPIEQLTSLSVLVQPMEHTEVILNFHRERLRIRKKAAGDEVAEDELRSSNLAGIAEILRQIAKFEARVPDQEMVELADMISFVRPETQVTMTPKNRTRLKALLEDRRYAMLLHAPAKWLQDAADPKLQPYEAALTAMHAAALEILLFLPIRRQNLLELRLDTHLRRPNSGGLISAINVPARMVKNKEAIAWPVDPDSARLLDSYIKKYRPLLAEPGNEYLFPGIGGSHRNAAEFGHELSRRVETQIGAQFNCHLARHFAVVRYLNANPGSYEVASQILGHRNPETTRRFYAGLEQDAAARHVNALLTRDRQHTKILALGAYHRPRRSFGREGQN